MDNRFPGIQESRAQEVERGLGFCLPEGRDLGELLSLTTDNAVLSVVGGLCF